MNRNPQGKYLQLMKEFIESNTHEGIVGRITFPKGGGQNANLRVYSALHKAEISDQKLEFVPLTEKQVITALRSEATN